MRWLQIGLAATTIASSFGKAISENKELEDYKPEDISRSLLRMISNNIGQVNCRKNLIAINKIVQLASDVMTYVKEWSMCSELQGGCIWLV